MSEHKGKYVSVGYMLDGWSCSCGWKSNPYFDGEHYAEEEFKKHVDGVTKDEQSTTQKQEH